MPTFEEHVLTFINEENKRTPSTKEWMELIEHFEGVCEYSPLNDLLYPNVIEVPVRNTAMASAGFTIKRVRFGNIYQYFLMSNTATFYAPSTTSASLIIANSDDFPELLNRIGMPVSSSGYVLNTPGNHQISLTAGAHVLYIDDDSIYIRWTMSGDVAQNARLTSRLTLLLDS